MAIVDIFKGSSSGQQPPPPGTQPPTVATAEVNVRLGFLRKVYTILTINFAITIGVSCIFTFVDPIKEYVVDPDHFWVFWLTLGVLFVTLILLSCVRLSYPINVVVLYIFVLAMSAFVGVTVARYFDAGQGVIVLQAFIATVTVFLSITTYCAITKKDFSFLYGFLFAGVLVILVLALLTFAIGWVGDKVSRTLSFIISVVGALVMTGYILADTSMVMTRFGPDNWLHAVVAIYSDVTLLFLYLLNIFSFVSS